jgi:hypothetical protein
VVTIEITVCCSAWDTCGRAVLASPELSIAVIQPAITRTVATPSPQTQRRAHDAGVNQPRSFPPLIQFCVHFTRLTGCDQMASYGVLAEPIAAEVKGF